MTTEPNWIKILSTPATEAIEDSELEPILSAPPFVSLPGLFNARDLNDGKLNELKSDYMFRAGSLENITSAGAQALLALNIKTIFDLRSQRERTEAPEPDLPGIECLWYPSTQDDPTHPTKADVNAYRASTGGFSWNQMYLDIMKSHRDSFKAVFQHILEHPDKPFLFHCTAGKDRTGVLAALILGLANVDIEYINHDYALTRVGMEPARSFLMQKWKESDSDKGTPDKGKQAVVIFP